MGISPTPYLVLISAQAPFFTFEHWSVPLIFSFYSDGKLLGLMGNSDASAWAAALSQQQVVHFFLFLSGPS